MGSGKGPIANATKKHELSCWDARIPSCVAHRDDMHRRALFVKHNALRETHKTAKTVFKDKIEDWTTEDEVKSLTDHFNDHESGKVITKLSVIKSTVLKDMLGTADEEKFKSALYIDVRTFKEAMASAVEDHLLELHKQ
eukprot:1744616-Rhodomonas_salina.1